MRSTCGCVTATGVISSSTCADAEADGVGDGASPKYSETSGVVQPARTRLLAPSRARAATLCLIDLRPLAVVSGSADRKRDLARGGCGTFGILGGALRR